MERQHEQLALPNRIVLLCSRDAPQHGATMTFSLDFNHGVLKDANDPRARDISRRINPHIDAALFRARLLEQGARREDS